MRPTNPRSRPPPSTARPGTASQALAEILRDRLQGLGPVTVAALAASMNLRATEIDVALIQLESEGAVMRGSFTPGTTETEWCERRLLARIHRYTVNRLRQEIEPVEPRDFMRFLFEWQRVAPEARVEGAGCGRQHRRAARRVRSPRGRVGNRDPADACQRIRPDDFGQTPPPGRWRWSLRRAVWARHRRWWTARRQSRRAAAAPIRSASHAVLGGVGPAPACSNICTINHRRNPRTPPVE